MTQTLEVKLEEKEGEMVNQQAEGFDLLTDVKYICKSTGLITESLQKGFDVAQLANGDIIITEVKTVNIQYTWDANKQRMVRISQC